MRTLPPRARFVLDCLAKAEGPIEKWSLIDKLSPGETDDNILNVYVSRIRRALGADAIETIRGGKTVYQLSERGRAAYALMCS